MQVGKASAVVLSCDIVHAPTAVEIVCFGCGSCIKEVAMLVTRLVTFGERITFGIDGLLVNDGRLYLGVAATGPPMALKTDYVGIDR